MAGHGRCWLLAAASVVGAARASAGDPPPVGPVSAFGGAEGMAGAFVAVANDPSAAVYNPAGLSFLAFSELLGSVATSFSRRNTTFASAYGQRIGPGVAVGATGIASRSRFSWGERRNEDTLGVAASARVPGLARPELCVGAGAWMRHSSLNFANASAIGFGFNGGVLAVFRREDGGRFVTLGASVRDFAARMRWAFGVYHLPATYSLGAAYEPSPSVMVTSQGEVSSDADNAWTQVLIRSGVEVRLLEGKLALRTGILAGPGRHAFGVGIPTAGAGVRLGGFSFDYGFSAFTGAGSVTHLFSLGLAIGTNWRG